MNSFFHLFVRSFTHSCSKYLLCVHSVPGLVLNSRNESEGPDNAPWPQRISVFTEVTITSLSIKITQILFTNTQIFISIQASSLYKWLIIYTWCSSFHKQSDISPSPHGLNFNCWCCYFFFVTDWHTIFNIYPFCWKEKNKLGTESSLYNPSPSCQRPSLLTPSDMWKATATGLPLRFVLGSGQGPVLESQHSGEGDTLNAAFSVNYYGFFCESSTRFLSKLKENVKMVEIEKREGLLLGAEELIRIPQIILHILLSFILLKVRNKSTRETSDGCGVGTHRRASAPWPWPRAQLELHSCRCGLFWLLHTHFEYTFLTLFPL